MLGQTTPTGLATTRLTYDARGRVQQVIARESARARMSVMVMRILNRYGYPPDLRTKL